jgi:hypothetical protein
MGAISGATEFAPLPFYFRHTLEKPCRLPTVFSASMPVLRNFYEIFQPSEA